MTKRTETLPLDFTAKPMRFNGPDYEPKHDRERLSRQHEKIRALMLDGIWRTLDEIADATNEPHASISAQLRHLRKARFGAFVVEKRSRGDRANGLFEYCVRAPTEEERGMLSRKTPLSMRVAELEREVAELKKGRS